MSTKIFVVNKKTLITISVIVVAIIILLLCLILNKKEENEIIYPNEQLLIQDIKENTENIKVSYTTDDLLITSTNINSSEIKKDQYGDDVLVLNVDVTRENDDYINVKNYDMYYYKDYTNNSNEWVNCSEIIENEVKTMKVKELNNQSVNYNVEQNQTINELITQKYKNEFDNISLNRVEGVDDKTFIAYYDVSTSGKLFTKNATIKATFKLSNNEYGDTYFWENSENFLENEKEEFNNSTIVGKYQVITKNLPEIAVHNIEITKIENNIVYFNATYKRTYHTSTKTFNAKENTATLTKTIDGECYLFNIEYDTDYKFQYSIYKDKIMLIDEELTKQ